MPSDYPQAHPDEVPILRDIEKRTGLVFNHVQNIAAADDEALSLILPIASEWIPLTAQPMRFVLYFLFKSKCAVPYLEQILQWRESETDELSIQGLTQALSILVTPSTARQIWDRFRVLTPDGLEVMLIVKLLDTNIGDEVFDDRISIFLNQTAARIERGDPVKTFAYGYLEFYAKVRHRKVREWFSHYVESTDKDLRRLALKSSGRTSPLPKGCWATHELPDLRRELFSTEVDGDDLPSLVIKLAKDYTAKFPPSVRSGQIVDALPDIGYVVCLAESKKSGPMELWLRIESSDSVEVRLIQAIRDPTPN
jgi:hypothetical protein